jgi:NB-ARC domain
MQCVPETSATYSKVDNIGLPVDHYGLNKFGSKNETYRMIFRKLCETIRPIASQKQRRLYSVPIGTVGSYTERHRLSAAVNEKIRVPHQKASVPYALTIHGLGGTGKTQLALKYVEDHQDDYNPILWIDAKDEDSVRSSFERCASELQLSVDQTQTQGSSLVDSPTVQAVLRWLYSRKDTDEAWLVIIDNADDVSWGIKKVLPKGQRGSVIITSQDSQSQKLVDGGYEEVRVDTMELLEARMLLLRHLRLDLEPVPQDIQEDCDKIAERLGYLALAIDLAGAYISNETDQRQAPRQYLADYARHQDDLLQSEHTCGLSTSDKTVWTVWDTTLEKIERRYANLRPGLLLAFLARFSDGVVQDELFRLASLSISSVTREMYDETAELPEWLAKVLAFDGKEWDDFCYRQGRKVLIRYNLLQRTQGD